MIYYDKKMLVHYKEKTSDKYSSWESRPGKYSSLKNPGSFLEYLGMSVNHTGIFLQQNLPS